MDGREPVPDWHVLRCIEMDWYGLMGACAWLRWMDWDGGACAWLAEQVGKEGADGCKEKGLHLKKKKIVEMPKIRFKKLRTKSDWDAWIHISEKEDKVRRVFTSVLFPSLVTSVHEVSSLEIACKWQSLSSCRSITIQISFTTEFISRHPLALSDHTFTFYRGCQIIVSCDPSCDRGVA